MFSFIEEIIFRGLLFKAMAKDNIMAAIIVSSVFLVAQLWKYLKKKIEEITNIKPELEELVKNNSLTNDKLLASLSKINNLLATLQSKNIDATIKNINAEIESIKTTLNEVNKNQKVAIQSLENNRENTQQ